MNPLNFLIGPMQEVGGAYLFFVRVLKTYWKTSGYRKAITAQVAEVSLRTLATVIFAGLFVGAILVLQFDTMLKRFDAQSLLGGLNTSATVREIGPLIISFLLAGKIGAFTTAELANMRVTEQIDAIESLGTNAVQYLIVPRFFGIILSSVVLLMIGLAVSILGALFIAELNGLNFYQYLAPIPRFVGGWTLFESFIRALIFSTVVATISTYKGFTASGGARGVGRAVTESAIYTNVFIIIANFICNFILEWVHDLVYFTAHLFERVSL